MTYFYCLLKNLLKNNKRKGVIVTVVLSIIISFYNFESQIYEMSKLNFNSINNLNKILNIIKDMTYQNNIQLTDAIKKKDWIAYISRKDNEYHIQQNFDQDLKEKIGVLNGEIKSLDYILYKH